MEKLEPISRILVTGATGFLGKATADALDNAGCKVIALGRVSDWLEAEQEIKKFSPQAIINLANHYLFSAKPADIPNMYEANVIYPLRVFSLCKDTLKRVVCVGTNWQGGANGSAEPPNLYAHTKNQLESAIQPEIRKHQMSGVSLRLYDVFGAEDSRPKILNQLVDSAFRGQTLSLSRGEQLFLITSVSEVIQAIKIALNATLPSGELKIFYARPNEMTTLRTVASEVEAILRDRYSISPRWEWGSLPYRHGEVMAPCMTGEVLQGWQSRMTRARDLEEFISARLAWFKKQV